MCACVCVCVCVCLCLSVHLSSLVCMVGVIFVYVDTVYWFYGYSFFMLNWMFQHDYLDTYSFECFICMHFVYLYLRLFSTIEHVSHGKAL